MSTISQDPTVFFRRRKILHDEHTRIMPYCTGILRSHGRPVEKVQPRFEPADRPDEQERHID